MKFRVIVKKTREYEVEADSRTETYMKAQRVDMTPLGAQEKAIEISRYANREVK